MNFTFTTQAPIVIFIGKEKEKVEIPRFRRKDWKSWVAMEDAKRQEEATKELDPEAKAKFIAFYTIPSTSPREISKKLMTFDGQEHVIKTCFKKVGWDDEKIETFLEINPAQDIETLAFALASIQLDVPQAKEQPATPDTNTTEDEEQKEEVDPKKSTETTSPNDSNISSGTGPGTNADSGISTPELTQTK